MSHEIRARKSDTKERIPTGLAGLSVAASLHYGPAVIVPIASLLPADSPRTEGEDDEHIRALAQVESDVPPIVVHRPTMRVIDGMHRLRAAVLCGRDTIAVRFSDGDERDLFVLAVELNSRHGLPLSQADRIAAATKVASSHPQLSDRVIARLTGLSAKTVGAIRRRSTEEIPQSNRRVGRDGKVRPLNTTHGRQLAGELMTERPEASLREIAREAGVSLGTAHDVHRRLHLGEDPVPPRQRSAEWDAEGVNRGPAVPTHDSENTVKLLRQLRRDPSLRFSETGRAVLRLLDLQSIPPATWTQLVDSIPTHCAEVVAEMARGCANTWLQFAEQVEQRGAMPTD